MHKDKPVSARHPGHSQTNAPEHHLVAQLREAMANKDIVTMGRMLELLGTIQAELVIGKPVVDGLVRAKTDSGAGSAAGKGRGPSPSGAPAGRIAR
jgi:hypothetical protein